MARDRGDQPRVAWIVAVLRLAALAAPALSSACGPRVQPDRPFPEETQTSPAAIAGPANARRAIPANPRGRQVVVGELCPTAAAGRPAIAPLLMRTTQWTDAPTELANAVERGSTPRFVAYSIDGKIGGTFDTVGLADLALGQSVASGTYVGAPLCTAAAGIGQRGPEDAACKAATGGCGVAAAELTRPDEPPPTPAYTTGGACVSGDSLAIDLDGDGAVEWFPLAGVLDSVRGPAQEWSASQNRKTPCTPTFSLYGVKLTPEAEPGKPADAKATVLFDLLGVIDLDADGRSELVIALRFPTVRTIVVYSAVNSPGRLELLGEAQSFQRP